MPLGAQSFTAGVVVNTVDSQQKEHRFESTGWPGAFFVLSLYVLCVSQVLGYSDFLPLSKDMQLGLIGDSKLIT